MGLHRTSPQPPLGDRERRGPGAVPRHLGARGGGRGTRFTWTLETGGLAVRLANAVAARMARQQLAADTLRLKQLLEQTARSGG